MSRFVISSIASLLISSGVLMAADKTSFQVSPAGSYAHQSAGPITVGAQAFDKPEMVESAFGKKADLLKYGVLPVLVVVENKGKTPLDMNSIEVNLVASDGRHANSVSPDELFHLARSKPKTTITPLPLPMPSKKNPLMAPEIVTRSFTARIVPPGDSASGFFYFEAKSEPDDKLYLNGIRDARSGQDVMYFEFPMASGTKE